MFSQPPCVRNQHIADTFLHIRSGLSVAPGEEAIRSLSPCGRRIRPSCQTRYLAADATWGRGCRIRHYFCNRKREGALLHRLSAPSWFNDVPCRDMEQRRAGRSDNSAKARMWCWWRRMWRARARYFPCQQRFNFDVPPDGRYIHRSDEQAERDAKTAITISAPADSRSVGASKNYRMKIARRTRFRDGTATAKRRLSPNAANSQSAHGASGRQGRKDHPDRRKIGPRTSSPTNGVGAERSAKTVPARPHRSPAPSPRSRCSPQSGPAKLADGRSSQLPAFLLRLSRES